MAREDGPVFVRWREEFVSQERGSRVVHYYLDDAGGGSHLAVVGTERSLRHMLYVVSEDFRAAWGCGGGADDAGGPTVFARKWRSRREVVDWLASFLPVKALNSKFSKCRSYADSDTGVDGYSETDSFQHQNLGKDYSSDITWSGSFWTCGKQLRHYRAFCRNGTTISTHTFVLVLSEEESRYLAYLEDMYEDKKGQKKVKVRWFHQNQEFACAIPPPPPHPCEVFITPFTQVISVECVDDIATVLTPDHYEKCSNALPTSSFVGIRFCFRQYSKNKFKHFDLSTLRGYFSQAVVLSLKIPAESEKNGEITPGKTKFQKQYERLYSKCLGTKICRGPQADSIPPYQILNNKQSPGKHFSIKFIGPQIQLKPTYSAGDRVEILSQDSGIIGCWFRCTVLKSCTNHNKLKVQYDDLQNADDSGRLEETVPASTLALPDKLGLRSPDRLRIRPRPQQNISVNGASLVPGTAIDVWQFSGWWEGIFVSIENPAADSLQVYFPGENFFRVCQLQDVRISKDWVKNKWVDIEIETNVLSRIPSDGVKTRQPDNLSSVGMLDSSSSALPEQELAAIQANSNGDKPVPGLAARCFPSLSNPSRYSFAVGRFLGAQEMADQETPVAVEAPTPVLGEPMDLMTALQLVMKKSSAHDGLVKGLREAAKAIEKHAAQLCVLADDCDQPDYVKLVKALCSEHNVHLVTVPSAKTLGEWAGLCKIDSEGKARKVVGCSCVVVKDYGEESEGLNIVQEYVKSH